MSGTLIIVIVSFVAFAAVLVISNKLFADRRTKYKKRSLENIVRDVDFETPDSATFVDDDLDKFGESVAHAPIIGNIYQKLVRSGSNYNLATYLLILLFVALISGYVAFLIFKAPIVAVVLGFIGLTSFNSFYLNSKLEKRNQQFLNDFPDAIDMIVRSIKSGHPLLTSLKLIAANSRPPLSTEFQRVIDEVSYGRPMPEALRKMADRIGILDVNFFVVILSVQQETGGSMAEVLNNLSTIIRKRKQLNLKIKALTSEGRITTKIFSAIPFFQMGAVYIFSRDYLDPLFNTTTGNIWLAVACSLIALAIYIARQLCKMDI